jgi:hypothetical protein
VLEWTDGRMDNVETPQEAYGLVRNRYSEMVVYDAGGHRRFLDDDLDDYDLRTERVALYWATEEASVDDDGSHAVAELVICEGTLCECPRCGWRGQVGERRGGDMGTALSDLECPACGRSWSEARPSQ